MNPHIFRAYDIRGTYPDELNAETARLIAKGYISYLIAREGIANPKIIVGKDNRSHGKELQDAFINGLKEHGAQVSRVEDCPSPMLYHALCERSYDGGVNITASHNPAEYNGFKLLGKNAHSIAGEEIQNIKELIFKEDFSEEKEGAEQSVQIDEAYYQKISGIVQVDKELKVVVDAGNGITGKYYPELLRRIGCEVIELYCEQDGTFPNHQPDPIVEANTEDLKKKVIEEKADFGIAFDGDGDRCGIIDEKGQFYDANHTSVLLIRDILSRHPNTAVIYTVSNSLIIPEAIEENGGKALMVAVGHSFVEIEMQKSGALLGVEQSGHFFIAENYYGFDDAGYTAANLARLFSQSNQSVSELYESIPKTFSIPEIRPHCPDEKKFEIIEEISQELSKEYEVNSMDGVRVEFEDGSWLGIRASNTSPKLSILMEAHSEEQLSNIKNIAKELLEKRGIAL